MHTSFISSAISGGIGHWTTCCFLKSFSKKIPVRIALATLLNFGLSLFFPAFWRVNVAASHSRTSSGTVSGVTSARSSSSSHIRLEKLLEVWAFLFFEIRLLDIVLTLEKCSDPTLPYPYSNPVSTMNMKAPNYSALLDLPRAPVRYTASQNFRCLEPSPLSPKYPKLYLVPISLSYYHIHLSPFLINYSLAYWHDTHTSSHPYMQFRAPTPHIQCFVSGLRGEAARCWAGAGCSEVWKFKRVAGVFLRIDWQFFTAELVAWQYEIGQMWQILAKTPWLFWSLLELDMLKLGYQIISLKHFFTAFWWLQIYPNILKFFFWKMPNLLKKRTF